MRVRVGFSKTEAMRYTSHLDLHRTWERTLRRAQLPLAYSQGFKPHARINLGCALPLGFTSQAEVVDFYLETELALPTVMERLAQATPPGLGINTIEDISPAAPALQAQIVAAEYEITLLQPIPELDDRLAGLLAASQLPRTRQGKSYDLRPLIFEMNRIPDHESGYQRISCRLSARENATGRPEEVILVLGGNPHNARVHRTRLLFHPT
jgi:radical SAM-linked protein